MSFTDLLNNSKNNSSIFSTNSGTSDETPDYMGIDAEMRRRKLNDAARMMDLKNANDLPSQRQGGLRDIFNPVGSNPNGAPIGSDGKPMNVVFKDNNPDPKQTTAEEDVDKDVTDQAKIDALGNKTDLGYAKLNLDQQKQDLNTQKNQQIFETKQKDMQRKVDEANSKLDLAERTLQSKQGDSDANLKFHQAQLDATNARHALEMSQKEAALEEAKRNHDLASSDKKDKNNNTGGTTTKTTQVDETGRKKTETTTKGGKRIGVTHPDGTHGTIDANDSKNLPDGWVLD